MSAATDSIQQYTAEITAERERRDFWEQFANLPKAENLENWTMEAIIASYPVCDIPDIYTEALQYIGWVNSL